MYLICLTTAAWPLAVTTARSLIHCATKELRCSSLYILILTSYYLLVISFDHKRWGNLYTSITSHPPLLLPNFGSCRIGIVRFVTFHSVLFNSSLVLASALQLQGFDIHLQPFCIIFSIYLLFGYSYGLFKKGLRNRVPMLGTFKNMFVLFRYLKDSLGIKFCDYTYFSLKCL